MLGALIELGKNGGGFILSLFVIGALAWLWALVTVIKDREMPDTDRIVWTVVLCTLTILGVILYFLLAPSRGRTEQELKDYFNNGGGSK